MRHAGVWFSELLLTPVAPPPARRFEVTDEEILSGY